MFEANDTETIPETDDLITVDIPSLEERFTIDSEEKANWLLNKLAAIEEEAARVKAQAKKRAEELEAVRRGTGSVRPDTRTGAQTKERDAAGRDAGVPHGSGAIHYR
jgi:uncharacterized protein (DUF342 family)